MELYTAVSYKMSQLLTTRYSSSFSLSSKLFPVHVRRHIYAIYGLVRIADEIVDTYSGPDQAKLLDQLEHETYEAIHRGYSPNPQIHAYSEVARQFGIDKTLIAPFFASMRMDLTPTLYTPELYHEYIYGSAEVIGLMCLRVFCEGDERQYQELAPGACALGSAYQKVNFLRDLAADYALLGRTYFPNVNYETLSSSDKDTIIADIQRDFLLARPALAQLPKTSRVAVATSFAYYSELLKRLDQATVAQIKANRVRVPTVKKLVLLSVSALSGGRSIS